jgi:hypothetical protein
MMSSAVLLQTKGFGFYGDNQRVTRTKSASIALGLILPPARDRIDSYRAALSKIRSGANPNVRMNGALVAGFSNVPIG